MLINHFGKYATFGSMPLKLAQYALKCQLIKNFAI